MGMGTFQKQERKKGRHQRSHPHKKKTLDKQLHTVGVDSAFN